MAIAFFMDVILATCLESSCLLPLIGSSGFAMTSLKTANRVINAAMANALLLPVPSVMKNVAQLHTEDIGSATKVSLQAFVLFFPKECRWVRVKSGETKHDQTVSVMTILLSDRTGPITMEVWGVQADSALQDLKIWSNDTNARCLIEVSHCYVRAGVRTCVPQTRKLSSSPQTQFSRVSTDSVPSILNEFTTIYQPLYLQDFQYLRQSRPFQVNLAGIVSGLQNIMALHNGNHMLCFQLHDSTGKRVLCISESRHVHNACVEEKSEIVIFFATVLPGLGKNNEVQLWLHDCSLIVQLQRNRAIPPTHTLMHLRVE